MGVLYSEQMTSAIVRQKSSYSLLCVATGMKKVFKDTLLPHNTALQTTEAIATLSWLQSSKEYTVVFEACATLQHQLKC